MHADGLLSGHWTVMRLTFAPSAVRTPRTRTFTPLLTMPMSAVSMRVTAIPGLRIEPVAPGMEDGHLGELRLPHAIGGRDAAPYRAVLNKLGSGWAAILFPLIGHFSLQSRSPVEVFATALSEFFQRIVLAVEFAQRRADASVDWSRIPRGISTSSRRDLRSGGQGSPSLH